MKKTKQKLLKLVLAVTLSTLPITLTPAVANASFLGALITTGIETIQEKNTLDRYNNTEEGRQEWFATMKQSMGVNGDARLNARLDNIMNNLTSAVGKVDPTINKQPYNYFLNPDTSFNAACSLGHNMTVNTGIFSLLGTDDEIAVVLAHEMAHGQKNHVIKGFEKSILPILAQSAVAGSGNTIASLGTNVLVNYTEKVHITKPQEWEADNLAFDYLAASNYNLGATAAVWQKVMEQYSANENSFSGDIFSPSDHPTHIERRDSYAKKINKYANSKVTVADGQVQINGKTLVTPVATASMSGAERSYFVAGNLAKIYHDNKTIPSAAVSNGTVYVGNQAIMTPVAGDTSASELASIFNSIK